jgi:hypothetical protein
LQKKVGPYVQLTDDMYSRVVTRARAAGTPPTPAP